MSDPTPFKAYFKELHAVAQQGDAREESFYPALANMLKTFADATGRKHIRVTTLPKPTDAGNPDFRLWNGTDRIVGYVEAKKPTEERLDEIEQSEQLTRYRATFPNLILTNFFEFRLYRNGERIQTVLAARPFVLTRLHTTPVLEKGDDLRTLLDRFLDFSLPQSFTAESLAVELAKRTRFLRDVVAQQLAQEKDAPGVLTGFFEAFQTYLIGALTPEDFADLFAQTITYGLFAARTRAGDGFNRRAAFDAIPHTIGVLRDLFRFISLGELPEQLAWCVDDIAEVLAVADVPGILDRYYHEGKGSDPIVHFYETFLAQYDPAERERRGVYYTPEPVVGYIVRSLRGILKTHFGKRDGLASDDVTLLDPAAGTMTFIARAAERAVAEFVAKYGQGGRADFIRRHILKNFYAFELMMAPYAIGHLKMSFFLDEFDYHLADNERMPFYLTNTLDMSELEGSKLPGLSSLAEESHLALQVKRDTPILVILGNPPYSGHSANTGAWIRGLIETYKQVDGKPLGEKNPKWLQDDYVKFLRFAQWKIEQAGRGVVGMITNHGYLDNPTFRGMRQSLMRTFDEIYVLDLHGNSLKKETAPDGSKDENVFDIRQGVAIAFFVKRGGKTKSDAVVRHADLYGSREAKYEWLKAHDIADTGWRELKPKLPFYLFVPQSEAYFEHYSRFPSVNNVFVESNTGLIAGRDRLAIQFSRDEVWHTVLTFSQMPPELARQAFQLGKDARDWSITAAQKDLNTFGFNKERIVPILYRPFDVRYTYYTGRNKGFLRWCYPHFMRHMLAGENVGLVTARQMDTSGIQQVFVANSVIDAHSITSAVSISYLFPLYLYPDTSKKDLFSKPEPDEREPNLDPTVVAALASAYGWEPTPEDIFHYVYAVLYAPTYRTKYAEFLRMDFPRIPFTADAELFRQLAALGERLVALHLLKSPELDPPIARFQGEGDGKVIVSGKKGLRYDAERKRVYINPNQYFEGVPPEVWAYQIGGYQVCHKWLKDRRDRTLTLDDIRTYCRIVTALARTIELQQEIDGPYPEAEKEIVPLPGAETKTKTDSLTNGSTRRRTRRP
nr:N-6 DNA methylase [Chloroflexota bacterium]